MVRWVLLTACLLAAIAMVIVFWGTSGAGQQATGEGPGRSSSNPDSRVSIQSSRMTVSAVREPALQERHHSNVNAVGAVRFRVLDEEGAPVPDATIVSGYAVLGTTAFNGELVVSPGEIQSQLVVVFGERFRTSSMLLPHPPPELVEVVLEPGGRGSKVVSGVVRFRDQSPVGEGVKVFAWAPERGAYGESIQSVLAGQRPGLVATTDSRGRFELDGLRERLSYRLIAGGMGCLSATHVDLAGAVTADGVSIEVDRVHGAMVRARQNADGPGASVDTFRNRVERISGIAEGSYQLEDSDWRASLLGLHAQLDALDRLLLVASTESRDQVGPIVYEASIPGFEEIVLEVWAEPAIEDIPVYEVELVQHAGGLGALLLDVDGPCLVALEGSARKSHIGEVLLFPAGQIEDSKVGERRMLRYRLFPPLCRRHELPGIPVGEYELHVNLNGGAFSFPMPGDEAYPLSIGQGSTIVHVPVDGCGALRLTLVRPDGIEYLEGATLMLGRGLPNINGDGTVSLDSFGSVSFRHWPFTLDGLAPGLYTMLLRAPTPVGNPREDPLSLIHTTEILAGAVSEVTIPIEASEDY